MRAPRQSRASRLATATAVSEEARLARRAETASRVLGAALRPPVPLAIVAVVLAVPFVALSLAIVPHGPDTPATMELADNVVTRPLPNAVVHGPIRFRDGGYWLAAHAQGTITSRVSMRAPEGDDHAFLFISANAYQPVTTTFSAVTPTGTRDLGAAAWSGLAQKLDVTPEAKSGMPFDLRVTTNNGLDEPVLMLTKIATATEPPLEWPSRLLLAVWGAVAVGLGLTLVRLANVPLLAGATLLLLLCKGFALRARELSDVAALNTLPDAVTYRAIADGLHHPYDTDAREPLWPLIVKAWFALVGSSGLHLRVLTVALSLVLVLVVYRFASAVLGSPFLALVPAGLVAVHPALVASSVQGLREELYAILLVLTAHVALFGASSARRRLAWLVPLVTALALLRMNTLYFVPLVLLLGVRRGCLRLRDAAIATAAALIALAPYLVYSQRHFGDPLWASNVHGVWYRNMEFVLWTNRGCDGCPTLGGMLATTSMIGKKITNTEYIFGMHPLSQVAADTLHGFYELALKPGPILDALLGDHRLVAVYLLGVVAAVALRQWELLVIVLLGINIAAFLVPIGGFDLRIVLHIVPFMIVIAVLPLRVLDSVVRQRPSLAHLTRSLRLRP